MQSPHSVCQGLLNSSINALQSLKLFEIAEEGQGEKDVSVRDLAAYLKHQ